LNWFYADPLNRLIPYSGEAMYIMTNKSQGMKQADIDVELAAPRGET
jgi:hypothetical protein